MNRNTRSKSFAALLLAVLLAAASAPAVEQSKPEEPGPVRERGRIVLSQPLPPMDGSRLNASVVTVKYAPGESSPPHSHPCPVIVYVVAGAIRTQVKGGEEVTIHAGGSFYEAPNGMHQVSANASRTEPAEFIAFFVCDNSKPLSSPVSAVAGESKR